MADDRTSRTLNYKRRIGKFDSKVQEQVFELIEQHFDLKKQYSERDWLNKNREEVPQTFTQYFNTQFQTKTGLPKISEVQIMQLWTEKNYSTIPFYKNLTEALIEHIQIFFPGVKCNLITSPPVNFNLEYLEANSIVRTRIRSDSNRK